MKESKEKIDRFVIIDDISDMNELNFFLVITNPQTGLDYENTLEAINILDNSFVLSKNI